MVGNVNKVTDDIPNDDDNFADNIKIDQPQAKDLQEALIGIEKDRREWLNKSYNRAWWIIGCLYVLMALWLLCNIKTTAWHTLLILGSIPTTLTIIVIKTLQPNHNQKDDKDEINLNSHAILETIKQQVSNITDILNKFINK